MIQKQRERVGVGALEAVCALARSGRAQEDPAGAIPVAAVGGDPVRRAEAV